MIAEIKTILEERGPHTFRKFGLTIGIILLMAGLAAQLFWDYNLGWLIYTGAGLVLAASLLPALLRPLYIIWMSIAVVLGCLVTRLLLSLIYYLVFTPVGLIVKISGKKLLERNVDQSLTSYWIERRDKPYSPDSTEKQY